MSPADLDVLQRVIRESGADQTPPAPSWAGYAGALLEAFVAWLERVRPDLPGLRDLPGVLGPAFAMIAAGLLVVVLLAIVRSISRRRSARRVRSPVSARAMPAPTPVADLGRDGWRSEIEHRLAAGDLAGALEASWWWFARAITTARVDPAWTSRELLDHAQRLELERARLQPRPAPLRRGTPGGEDIRAFLRRAEQTLP